MNDFCISSTTYYRETMAVDIRIVSTPVKRANSDIAVGRRKLLSLHGLCKTYKEMKNV